MDRRSLLSALGLGMSGFAGCGGAVDSEQSETPTDDGPDRNESAMAEYGIPSTICEEEIRADPGIAAITDPAFGPDWDEITPAPEYRFDDATTLSAEQTVIGLEGPDGTRAYPLAVLYIHEIVNDAFGRTDSGERRPVIVTYCPICRSGLVADRRLDGEPTTFLVSGLLWQPESIRQAASERDNRTFGAGRTGGETDLARGGNLVMYDEATLSYWSQILGEAICGPEAGDRLPIVPSTVTTWGEWRSEHPGTVVLLPPPHSETVDS
ncbi:hypothetical protein DJ82_06260 [Halorubrum sp. Ib24]|uniref:DUF3179 domain-containing (seleno)protein n=1 Tax=Halorubrum sp. Ib24 TaxID=1383850 RepID=UPI000B980E63|nr:DUF3179 domain-containing (seleno)protein [Halorubrum sp. Ib24]OYR41108.1 hypothetical protein DJ82_06260 [Halorubrum sp. Ib24]